MLIVLGTVSPGAGKESPDRSAQTAAILQGFADALLIRHRTEYAFDTFVSTQLVQHTPAARDGRSAAIALIKPLISSPGADFKVSTLIVDGDYGVLYYRGSLGRSGQAAAVAELYRMQGGKLVEHWDAFQPVPAKSVSAHPMFGALASSLPAPCTGATPQDRAAIIGFADLLYGKRDVRAAFERYAAPDMIQHDPGLPDGRDAAIAELTPILGRPATRITIAHILVCRGMGVIHLRSQYATSPGHVIFDIVRINDGKIVEHWDVFQPIATTRVNPRPQI
jgi:predicted SnoaL-like aldol condensation-catalyzing enzyme